MNIDPLDEVSRQQSDWSSPEKQGNSEIEQKVQEQREKLKINQAEPPPRRKWHLPHSPFSFPFFKKSNPGSNGDNCGQATSSPLEPSPQTAPSQPNLFQVLAELTTQTESIQGRDEVLKLVGHKRPLQQEISMTLFGKERVALSDLNKRGLKPAEIDSITHLVNNHLPLALISEFTSEVIASNALQWQINIDPEEMEVSWELDKKGSWLKGPWLKEQLVLTCQASYPVTAFLGDHSVENLGRVRVTTTINPSEWTADIHKEIHFTPEKIANANLPKLLASIRPAAMQSWKFEEPFIRDCTHLDARVSVASGFLLLYQTMSLDELTNFRQLGIEDPSKNQLCEIAAGEEKLSYYEQFRSDITRWPGATTRIEIGGEVMNMDQNISFADDGAQKKDHYARYILSAIQAVTGDSQKTLEISGLLSQTPLNALFGNFAVQTSEICQHNPQLGIPPGASGGESSLRNFKLYRDPTNNHLIFECEMAGAQVIPTWPNSFYSGKAHLDCTSWHGELEIRSAIAVPQAEPNRA